jgi:hypothetical protein
VFSVGLSPPFFSVGMNAALASDGGIVRALSFSI